ncbi:hypothetical protein OG930_40875 [Streptomyces sp. NBC_01799]|uniref:hypothetical protein n=1 Tax=Streptomyces sp. NBC_01800 TaxID=2975945 RepID=UPI002DD9473D|nr:hypothetical protein [Streptomyces sp. NBC_01800]WSA72835.1 hypothetical protein OIE65_41485 [Streptomyces sp. NBC_01800]WSA81361.1 hypothetical protein OG930_40875 [Streptomyces sp. NBC_01799]
MSVAIASLAVAGGAVLGAGSTASAATATPEHAQRPAVSVETDDHRWGGDRDHRWGGDRDYGWYRLDDYRISYLWEGRRYSDDCCSAGRTRRLPSYGN